MFQCLVIRITLRYNQYTMFTPGFAIYFLATILGPDHVRGVQWPHGHAVGVRGAVPAHPGLGCERRWYPFGLRAHQC
jgi:hypothetical protein